MSAPKRQAQKTTGTKSEARKVVQKVRKERDEACVREEALRERLKVVETINRTQLRELRDKLKYVNGENKELNLVLNKLRPELGLESEAGLRGRVGKEPGLGMRAARDAVKELQEQAKQCRSLREENSRCSERMRALTRELAETSSARQGLQEQLQAVRNELQSVSEERERCLRLWQEVRSQRDHLLTLNQLLRQAAFHQRNQTAHKTTQTPALAPINRRLQRRLLPGAAAVPQEPHRQGETMRP